jgi:hypothetical protein
VETRSIQSYMSKKNNNIRQPSGSDSDVIIVENYTPHKNNKAQTPLANSPSHHANITSSSNNHMNDKKSNNINNNNSASSNHADDDCVQELRAIIGATISAAKCKELLEKSDGDVNRAINNYFEGENAINENDNKSINNNSNNHVNNNHGDSAPAKVVRKKSTGSNSSSARSRNPYQIFVSQNLRGSGAWGDKLSAAASKWKSMHDFEKIPYKEQANREKEAAQLKNLSSPAPISSNKSTPNSLSKAKSSKAKPQSKSKAAYQWNKWPRILTSDDDSSADSDSFSDESSDSESDSDSGTSSSGSSENRKKWASPKRKRPAKPQKGGWPSNKSSNNNSESKQAALPKWKRVTSYSKDMEVDFSVEGKWFRGIVVAEVNPYMQSVVVNGVNWPPNCARPIDPVTGELGPRGTASSYCQYEEPEKLYTEPNEKLHFANEEAYKWPEESNRDGEMAPVAALPIGELEMRVISDCTSQASELHECIVPEKTDAQSLELFESMHYWLFRRNKHMIVQVTVTEQFSENKLSLPRLNTQAAVEATQRLMHTTGWRKKTYARHVDVPFSTLLRLRCDDTDSEYDGKQNFLL